MLPSAKHSLREGGYSNRETAWILILLFLGGAVGIQALSSFMHRFIPTHVVDCDHSHEEEEESEMDSCDDEEPIANGRSPLMTNGLLTKIPTAPDNPTSPLTQRPSLASRLSSRLNSSPVICDENGQCFGFSDPCGAQCFKNMTLKSNYHLGVAGERQILPRNSITTETTPLLRHTIDEESGAVTPQLSSHKSHSGNHSGAPSFQSHTHSDHKSHHHHVPENAFLSIGLQTSVALALHKLPEGFITYATNHANPQLGFTVFISLFIHNITEGFAIALPLYLALQSRPKAMVWSAFLGGASQPLGAAIAALWFKIAGHTDMKPGGKVYGCMFALVAGIMTNVALQLFAESMELTHSRRLCITFAFVGMGLLGVSSALTV
jgi:ZIP family zinc transporter